MRFHLLGLVLLAGAAMPSVAQDYVQPEIQTQAEADPLGGIPAGTAVANLTARVDALEAQLARLTGQNEEAAYRVRQLEQELEAQKRDFDLRLKEMERAAAAPAPEPEAPASDTPASGGPDAAASVEAPGTGDPAEDAYLLGFRQWEAKQYAAAQKSLEAAAKQYPRHRRASYAANLAGRAYLDDGKPAAAARILLANYQDNPEGERAADSLYFLGQALMELKKPTEACQAYAELADKYPDMRSWVKQRLPQARTAARCD